MNERLGAICSRLKVHGDPGLDIPALSNCFYQDLADIAMAEASLVSDYDSDPGNVTIPKPIYGWDPFQEPEHFGKQ